MECNGFFDSMKRRIVADPFVLRKDAAEQSYEVRELPPLRFGVSPSGCVVASARSLMDVVIVRTARMRRFDRDTLAAIRLRHVYLLSVAPVHSPDGSSLLAGMENPNCPHEVRLME